MGRPKGSKNKAVEKLNDMDEIVSKSIEPVYYDKSPSDVDIVLVTVSKNNPLIGYTLDEIKVFVDEVNPQCARGGCLHRKGDHYIGNGDKNECHVSGCKCSEFIV